MYFKTWLLQEVAEPRKPQTNVRRNTLIKDKGTNVARKIIQYTWKTPYGNTVKLQFEPKGNGEYFVIFYVNDVLFDYGSKLGLADKDATRDSEILSNVFYVLKDKADKLKATALTFHGHSSDRDTKVIRNLDIQPYKTKALAELNKFVQFLQNHQVKMIPPSQTMINLHQKLGKPMPEAKPDIDVERWLAFAEELENAIDKGWDGDYVYRLQTAEGLGLPNVNNLIASLKDFNNAVESHTERGYQRTKNRRTAVYKRILDKHFSDKWDIQITGNNFRLMRVEM